MRYQTRKSEKRQRAQFEAPSAIGQKRKSGKCGFIPGEATVKLSSRGQAKDGSAFSLTILAHCRTRFVSGSTRILSGEFRMPFRTAFLRSARNDGTLQHPTNVTDITAILRLLP